MMNGLSNCLLDREFPLPNKLKDMVRLVYHTIGCKLHCCTVVYTSRVSNKNKKFPDKQKQTVQLDRATLNKLTDMVVRCIMEL